MALRRRPPEQARVRPRSHKAALDRHQLTRPARPGAAAILHGTANAVLDRLAGRPTPPPLRGRWRLRWLQALEHAITTDARRSVVLMERRGWERAEALAAYRAWLVGLVDAAVGEAEERDG